MARQVVPAPPRREPVYSLVLAAEVLGAVQEGDWVDGWRFRPEGCAIGDAVAAADCDLGWDAAPDPAASPALVEGDPIAVRVAEQCSALGWQAVDLAERARRALRAVESHQIARELWSGTIAAAESAPTFFLADDAADQLTTAAVAPELALGALEAGLGNCGVGRGMVHANVLTLAAWVAAGAVRREGGLWVTPMGHVVVADSGYPVAGASQTAYATPMVQLLLGRVDVVPGSAEEALDTSNNTLRFYAWRMAGWLVDPCCHVAAEVDLAAPDFGGAG
jgi:hypothetical protein